MGADRSLLVIGGGPAGITAALQACELGAQVTLLEAAQIGGTSLNRGPAPVRTLARAARLARDWSSWATFGLDGPAPVPEPPAVLANSQRVARYAHDKKDMAGHLRRQGIELVEDLGPVGFTGPHTVAASDGRTWSADRIILAVGGHAGRLPDPRRRARAHLRGHPVPDRSPGPGRRGRRGRHRLPDRLDPAGPGCHRQPVRGRAHPAARRGPQRLGGTGRRLPGPGHGRAHGHAGRQSRAREGGAVRVDYRTGPVTGQIVGGRGVLRRRLARQPQLTWPWTRPACTPNRA